jgi:hypothetical protein
LQQTAATRDDRGNRGVAEAVLGCWGGGAPSFQDIQHKEEHCEGGRSFAFSLSHLNRSGGGGPHRASLGSADKMMSGVVVVQIESKEEGRDAINRGADRLSGLDRRHGSKGSDQ